MSRPHEPANHQQVWELLAWYVNGTATPEQRRIVDSHLPDCANCRAEHALQRQLAAHLHDDRDDQDNALAVPDPAPGLARLLADIDRPQPRLDQAPSRQSTGANRRWKLAVAALGALAVLETATLATLGIGRADYQTLSSATPERADGRVPTIRLVPASSMSVGELQGVLRRHGLQVVAGPTEAGVYSLAPLQASSDHAAALAGLRATPGVLFAEPVGARP